VREEATYGGALALSSQHHQRFLLAVEGGQRELGLAAELLDESGVAKGIHRHLEHATEWITEARRLLNQR
jgi:hypothetical protein